MKIRRSIPLSEVIPQDLPGMLVESSKIGLGLDVATTEKEKSNPSSLALTEQVGREYIVRLLMRWKTKDPEVTKAILRAVLLLIAPRRGRKLCVDASSEKFFASQLKREFAALIPTDLIVSGESTEYLGEHMSFKVYLGNLLVNTLEDGRIILPNEVWIKNDFRLVKRDRGSFATDIDEEGNHGDSFDAVKLSLHALIGAGGPVAACAAQVGSYGAAPAKPSLNPFAHLFRKRSQINA